MNSFVIVILLGALSYASAQSCDANNPCDLNGYFIESNGYGCFQSGGNYVCTCPNNAFEFNTPCRLCNRMNSQNNVCRNNNGRLMACLETNDFGGSYACVCANPSTGLSEITSDADCDTTVTLTTRPTTTVASGGAAPICKNGGVFLSGICHCPSGYAGALCEQKVDKQLCERIFCKNGGVCAIRNPTGPFEAVCLCPYGTWGTFCELNGTLGSCSSSLCMNGGACSENAVGSTRFAYCFCKGGFKGRTCETKSFNCRGVGSFPDLEMYDQGGYFECKMQGSSYVATERLCPKGLRYNLSLKSCAY